MNSEDRELLEDFVAFLDRNFYLTQKFSNVEVSDLIEKFKSSNNYNPKPVDAVSKIRLPITGTPDEITTI